MKKRFASSLRASSIEPETSIRQNMTALVVGTGRRTRLRKRRSIGSRYGMRISRGAQRGDAQFELDAVRSPAPDTPAPCSAQRARASSSPSCAREPAPIAMRRPIAPRIERMTLRLARRAVDFEKPARWLFISGVSASCVRVRRGSARSSKKICMNSSLVRWKTKSSSPSPESLALPLPATAARRHPSGRSIWSPRRYS